MKTNRKTGKSVKRHQGSSLVPLLLLRRKHSKAKTRKYLLVLTRKQSMTFNFRKFTTNPKRRSKKINQIVYTLRLFGYKELAVTHNYYKRNNPGFAKKLARSYGHALMLAGVFGLAYFNLQIAGVSSSAPPLVVAETQIVEVAEEIYDEKYLPSSKPVGINIPSIGVEAEIQTVGLLEDGSMETPDIFSDKVGWYEYSPTPGEKGPSIMTGHVDNYKGPAVFWRLGEVKAGAIISVSRMDGSIVKFEAVSVKQFEQNDFPSAIVYGNTDNAELRLITCGGEFNYFSGKYSANTIVFAKLVSE